MSYIGIPTLDVQFIGDSVDLTQRHPMKQWRGKARTSIVSFNGSKISCCSKDLPMKSPVE